MDILEPDILLFSTISLYFLAAIAALVFSKKHQISKSLSLMLCLTGSLTGIILSLKLLISNGHLSEELLPSNIPFFSFSLSIDVLSAFFILILSMISLCVSIYSFGYLKHYEGKRNIGVFQFLYSTFLLSMLLVFIADNSIFFFIAWELMAVISYFLVVFESEEEENRQAGLIYLVMTHIGTAFIMIAFMIIFYYTGSFDLSASNDSFPDYVKNILFIFFLIGFSTKAGVIPLHIWLPYAHPAAPGNISALMSGVMIKTAIYGLIRFVFVFLGFENTWWGVLILVIGMLSALFGVLYAYIEKNIKKMLAYSSIENMGIIFIALGVSFIAFSENNIFAGALAITAGLLHCFNHSLFKSSLFLGVSSVHYATHTKNIEELGGLIKKMPKTAILFLGGCLSISAILPFNGFISEWLTYQSLFYSLTLEQNGFNMTFILAVSVLAISGALAAACFIKLFGISFLGLGRTDHALEAKEVPAPMIYGSSILVLLCIITGIFPLLVISLVGNVTYYLAEANILNDLNGSFVIVTAPLAPSLQGIANTSSVSPLSVFLLIVVIVLAIIAILRLVYGKYVDRTFTTWDCGFKELNSRMQYSGTAFSKPIKIVFRMFFRSSKNLKTEGDYPYHPESMEYTVVNESVFEKYIYVPILLMATGLSKKLKYMIQTGSIHTYLLYIFITVLILMLYNKIG